MDSNNISKSGYAMEENSGLDFSHGFPCGIMHCTCEKFPRVIYANRWIFDILGFEPNGEYWNGFLKDNIYFMIPSEDWPSFQKCLTTALETGKIVNVEHRVKNKQDKKINIMGWVRTIENEAGDKEYLFLYISLPREQEIRHSVRERAYLGLLSGVYDGVFKIDRQTHVVECLSIDEKLNSHTYFMQGMRVVLDCLLQKSYYMLVYLDDRRRVEEFFSTVVTEVGFSKNGNYEVGFRTIGDGILKEFVLTATELDDETALLCCRDVTEEKSARRRKEEQRQVRSIEQRVGDRADHAPIKVVTYRLLKGRVFAQSGDYLTDSGIPLEEFLKNEKIPEDKFQEAMNSGEVSLDPLDEPEKRHLYITHRSAMGAEEEHLLLIYRFAQQELAENSNVPRVTIHTFGYFDILVDGRPIVFPHEKSKEMLALMVDRKGSFVGNPYFISCLWEDEPYSEKIQSRCRQTAFRMMETLKKYGIEDIIEKVDGHRRVIPEKVNCDYFDYINGKAGAKQKFNGTYMSDYTWGEETLSTLLRSVSSPAK